MKQSFYYLITVTCFLFKMNPANAQTSSSLGVSGVLLTVTKTSTDENNYKFCFKIKESQVDTIKSEKEYCDYVRNPDMEKFKIVALPLLTDLLGKEFIEKNDSAIKANLETVFNDLENEDLFDKIEYGKNIYTGLSDKEIAELETKLKALRGYQNELRKSKRVGGNVKKEYYDYSVTSKSKIYEEFTNLRINKLRDLILSFTKDSIERKKLDSIRQHAPPKQVQVLEEQIKQQKIEEKEEPTPLPQVMPQGGNITKEYRSYLRSQIKRTKKEIWDKLDKREPVVSLIGNANVVASFKVLDQTQANAGFGVMVSNPSHYDFIGILTVAQTSDTISSNKIEDYGQSILTPGVRKFSFLSSFRQTSIAPLSNDRFLRRVGLAFNVNVTPYQWALKNTAGEDSAFNKVIPVSADVMFPINWVKIYKENKDISVSTDLGLTFRYIAGNADKPIKNAYLKREDSFYPGLIFGLYVKYNGLRVQFHGPMFFGKRVPGLTGGQVYASIGFIGSILSNESKVLKKK